MVPGGWIPIPNLWLEPEQKSRVRMKDVVEKFTKLDTE